MKKLVIVVILLMLMLAHLMINTNKKIYEISSNIELPLGSSIPTIEDFCKESVIGKIQVYFQNEPVNTLNQTGNYQVKINIDNQDYLTTLTVIDKEAPNLITNGLTKFVHSSRVNSPRLAA